MNNEINVSVSGHNVSDIVSNISAIASNVSATIPKVTVIVPCYGVEQYLERCMSSLLGQTLREIEILLIDDESPDHVPQMCDEYAEQHRDAWPRVRVIHKKNGGLGMARNTGLDEACGEYVAFVDGDDFVEQDMYGRLYAEAQKTGAEVVYSNFFMEGQPGVWTKSREVENRMEWSGDNVRDFLLDMIAAAPYEPTCRQRQMSVWHSIYQRNLIEKYGIRFHSEREVLSEDYPFQMDFLLRTQKVVYLPEAYYHYCLNTTSLTLTFRVEKFERIRNLHRLMSQQLEGTEGAGERLDRFFITYMHARMDELILSSLPGKDRILQEVLSYPEWHEIMARYPASYLPAYPRLYYRLMKGRHTLLLKLLTLGIYRLKRLRGMKA